MKTGKVLICDGVLALLIILGLNACDQNLNSRITFLRDGQKISSVSDLSNSQEKIPSGLQ